MIVVLTDDQPVSTFRRRYMPRTFELIAGGGTRFEDYVVATPLCCPSRASYLTGQYPHNNGVFANRDGYGSLRGKRQTLPAWMRAAGYRTAWVGKHLQGYPQAERPTRPAPGIDEWFATFRPPEYQSFRMAQNGRWKRYGAEPRDYYTSVVSRIASGLIREAARKPRPLFMTVNNLAPHRGSGAKGRCAEVIPPAPADRRAYSRAPLPKGGSFNEKDVSDKPPFVPRKRLSRKQRRELVRLHQCGLAALRGVDRQVGRLHETLRKTGELSNSVIVFTSDNGSFRGEHRLIAKDGGRNRPYEEGIHQPLAILAGGKALSGAQAPRSGRLAANIDLAPTILDFAGAEPCRRPGRCRTLDGRSLVPLLRGREESFPPDREILIEGGLAGGDCQYAGVRTPGVVYLEHARPRENGSCDREWATELYDFDGSHSGSRDPNQLENLTSPRIPESRRPAVLAERRRLDRRLAQLRGCSGADCR